MKKWKLPKRILAAALAGSLLLSVCAFAQDSQETTAISGESDTSVLTDEQVSGGTGTAVLADGQDSGSKEDRPFTDVQDETQYYYTPVYWGYDLGVTKGTSETLFSPSDTCTRAQFVTFLYRLAGEPDVSGLSTNFTDLNSAEYYYNAVLWADANGITEGKTSTTFAPGDNVSREEVVTFLYRYAGGSYSNNPFTDVVADNYAYEAILWAYENGITLGTSATTFSPKDLCTRAMTITFLYRMYMLENGEDETLVSIDNDGSTTITDAAYDAYFETTAAEGVEALLNAGACCVNGIQVPASEDEVEDGVYYVDGVKSLYLTDEGWGYNVHKTTSLGNDTFDVARLAFYETLTTVRGHVTQLTLDADGNVTRIDVDSYEVVLVNDIVDNGDGTVTIQRGEFDLETARVRVDIETISFPEENVDSSIEIGDIAYYYYGPDGWVITRAIPVVGTVSKDSDGAFVVTMSDGSTYTSMESNVSRYNLYDAARPTQFYNQTYTRLGLTDQEVNMWCTPNGYPIGFTFANPKSALKEAIENAQAALASVVIAESDEEVEAGVQWAFQEDVDAFEEAIAAAQKVYRTNSTSDYGYAAAIYELGQAYGQGGSSPSGFIGSLGTGTMGAGDTGSGDSGGSGDDVEIVTGNIVFENNVATYAAGSLSITDAAYDEYYATTAAEGVEALLNAGKVTINGYTVPAEETTTVFKINGNNALYADTDSTYAYKLYGISEATGLSFQAARLAMVEAVSTAAGMVITLTADEDGYISSIEMSMISVARITVDEEHGGQSEYDCGVTLTDSSAYAFGDLNRDFYVENILTEVDIGDIVLYWCQNGTWYIETAQTVSGTLSVDADGKYVINGVAYETADVWRANLFAACDPDTFYAVYEAFGLADEGIEVTAWLTDGGAIAGFTFTSAKAALKTAVAFAEADDAAAEAIADAVSTAKKTANANSTAVYAYEPAALTLYEAYAAVK